MRPARLLGCASSWIDASALAGSLLAAVTLAGCVRPATAIVVVVDSDLAVPSELASVHADVGGAACADASCAHDFALGGAITTPFSFTVSPAGDGGALSLRVAGRDGMSVERVSRTVTTSFVSGRTVVLRVFLARACVDHAVCGAGETCVDGACASDAIDPSTLATIDPGHELDGGPREDGGVDAGTTHDAGDAGDAGDARDTGGPDAADATIDAGTAPASCASVASTTSGAFSIDPDGNGGSAPFLAYCELAADGGGWTLLATVDGSADTLPYGDMRWTSAGPGWGTADLSVQDALFPAYYTLPVRELRVVMAPIANPLATHALHAAFMPSAVTTLRAAMEAAGHVTLPLAAADWTAILPAPISLTGTTCESSGVPAGLPTSTPTLRVRIGYVWSDQADCAGAAWVGAGAAGGSCSAGATGAVGAAGGGRMCGGMRSNERAVVWVFGR